MFPLLSGRARVVVVVLGWVEVEVDVGGVPGRWHAVSGGWGVEAGGLGEVRG